MKVIIKETSEIKEVAFGYAVNFLFPKGLAKPATAENIKVLQAQKKAKSKKIEQKKQKQDSLAQKIAGKKVVIKAKKTGKLKTDKKIFGQVTKKNIIKALGLDSKEAEVIISEPIKTLGKHKVELKIGGKKVNVEVEVVAK